MAISKKIIGNIRSNSTLSVLLAIFILNITYSYYWVKIDTIPPAWDQSSHMLSSLAYYNELINPSADLLKNLLSIDYYYPPFFTFSAAIFYLFFGTSPDASVMLNSVYLLILLFSIYGTGTRLFDKKTGIIAAIFVSLFPAVFNLQRDFLLDFPLIAMVSLTIYFLVASEDFKNRNNSLLFGISLAGAILTKWTAFFFIAGPTGYVILKAFIQSSRNNRKCYSCGEEITDEWIYLDHHFCSEKCRSHWKKQVLNFIFSITLAIILAGIWYIPNFNSVYNILVKQQSFGAFEGDPEILTVDSFLYYLIAAFNSISLIFFLVFLCGLIVLSRKRSNSAILLYSAIIIPYLAFTLFRNKDPRYIMPVFVSVSLIGAVFLSSIKTKKLFLVAMILISFFGITQLFPHEIGLKDLSIQTSYGPLFLSGPEARAPVNQDWKIESVFEDIYNDSKYNNRILTRGSGIVGVIPDMPYVNGLTYYHYSYSNNLSLHAVNCVYLSFYDFTRNLFNFDYIVVRSDKNEGSPNSEISEEMKKLFFDMKEDKYILLKQYQLPDNSTLFIYKNTITELK